MFHYGGACNTAPASPSVIEARRHAETHRRAFVHVFGPVKGPQDGQPHYGHHHATGLLDCLKGLNIPEIDWGVNTIEMQLAKILVDYSPADGWDAIVVHHEDPTSPWLVFDAGRIDRDARECLDRVYGVG
jgi:hypothetical protein